MKIKEFFLKGNTGLGGIALIESKNEKIFNKHIGLVNMSQPMKGNTGLGGIALTESKNEFNK